MSDLTLYRDDFWISPYVFTCDVTLREKGLAYDVVSVALQRGEQGTEVFSTASVTARVPALRHGDFVVAESSAIVEYLEDAFPEHARVLPPTRRSGARARQVMSWIRSDDTLPIREERRDDDVLRARDGAAERRGEGRGGEAGDRGDTAAGARRRAHRVGVEHRRRRPGVHAPAPDPERDCAAGERLRAYAERVWARPTVRAFVERERHPYVAY